MGSIRVFTLILALTCLSASGCREQGKTMIDEHVDEYSVEAAGVDETLANEIRDQLNVAMDSIEAFFEERFESPFLVRIHKNRISLDSTWQSDWNMPSFKSQCWMVASGVASHLDILSPESWKEEACEHDASDTVAVKRLIMHELVHVFHGQRNASPDFSDVSGIDWFVEGLATYVSGQCDAVRMGEVKEAVEEGLVPEKLEDFWTGSLKYGLSGSMVMYIAHKYGKESLYHLLPLDSLDKVLTALETTAPLLIGGWKEFLATFRIENI